jgi:16S rRNA (guanine527-N7)-methyltransferase
LTKNRKYFKKSHPLFSRLSFQALLMTLQAPANYGPEEFQKETGISRDVLQKFQRYAEMLEEWNEKASLVGPVTLPQIWHRHFLDSAQTIPLLPKQAKTIADIGSGAGFPGLVLAAMGVENITLFERNTRKASFLQAVSKELGLNVEIMNLTTEEYPGESFDVITARAVADLSDLLYVTRKLRKPSSVLLFLKGKNLDAEIREAQKDWEIPDLRRIASVTDPQAAILRITGNIRPLR